MVEFVGAGTLLLAVSVLFCWSNPRRAEYLVFNAFLAVIFCAGTLRQLFPAKYLLLVVLSSGILIFCARSTIGRRHPLLVFSILPLTSVGLVLFASKVLAIDASVADRIFRYVILMPASAIYGLLAAKSLGRTRAYRGSIAVWALLNATFASIEGILGRPLFTAPSAEAAFNRDGVSRALVMSEHPLVLGALLAVALPFVFDVITPRYCLRFLAAALMFSGLYATASRGAIVVYVLMLLGIQLRRGLARIPRSMYGWIAFAVAFAYVGIITVLLLTTRLQRSLASVDPVAASSEYREAIYTYIPVSLIEQPFGWGVAGLPPNHFVLSSYFGAIDIATSVDSEFVLVAFDFGWIGLGIFGLLIIAATQPRFLMTPEGLAASGVLISGLFLALHSWLSIPMFLLFLMGAFPASRAPRPHASIITGTRA